MSKTTPTTQRALVMKARGEPLTIEQVPIPIATPGSVVVKVITSAIHPNTRALYSSHFPFYTATPATVGLGCIGRVESVGPDATILKPGQMVLCDYHIRARDDPNITILHTVHGGDTEASKKLMDGEWRDGSLAEYAKFPLENVFILDEKLLPYAPEDLIWLRTCIIPYGGLDDIGLKAGETIIIAPSTGQFGGVAVALAHAMGANVIAVGRDQATLNSFKDTYKDRLTAVTLKGDVKADTEAMLAACPHPTGADAYMDLSPTVAAKSTHIASALGALAVNGRASFMGGIFDDVSIPYAAIVYKSLRIVGTYMYTKAQIREVIKLAETGSLKLGKASGVSVLGPFGLEQIEEAMKASEENIHWGKTVVVNP